MISKIHDDLHSKKSSGLNSSESNDTSDDDSEEYELEGSSDDSDKENNANSGNVDEDDVEESEEDDEGSADEDDERREGEDAEGSENEDDEGNEDEDNEGSENEAEGNDNSDGSEDEGFGKSHKKSLAKLEKTDPEFFKFLKENDRKLLEFSSSDENEEDESENEEVFKPPTELHEDSEDSEFEGDEKKKDGKLITLSMVKKWRQDLINDPSFETISAAVDAFNAALCRVTGDDDSEYTVEGSGVFNAIIEMCVLHLQKSVSEFLKLTPSMEKHPEKAKKWNKIKTTVERYFTDLFKLLGGVTSDNIISVLLKHLHSCCGMVVYFHKLTKIALKQLTKLWSTGEETVRVLAFLCILRLCTIKKSNILNSALKSLYIAYIRGSKFVSINTLPQINFMKRSLVDLFALDPLLSYQHAFLYIRQLAIHLRNAVTLHKKESFQSVYNWQYIHSLRLWVDLMCETKDNSELQQLVYPLVQVILGTVKLIPTAQYLPLRFHCIEMLIKLNRELGVFIPVLPLIVDSLTCCDLNKQNKKVSMKPFDFTFVLRLSKPAMTENGFQDAVVEYVYQFLLNAGSAYSCNIAFPDLFIPTIMQLKNVLKNCKTAKYTNKLKQVLIKIEENSKFIQSERSKINLNLNEFDRIRAFESDMEIKVPPLMKYWNQMQNLNNKKRLRDAKAAEDEKKKKVKDKGVIPEEMKLQKVDKSLKRKKDNEPVEFLPSDESDFEFPEEPSETPEKPKKKKNKKLKSSKTHGATSVPVEEIGDEDEDVLEDLNIDAF